jgi:hypothetical protein
LLNLNASNSIANGLNQKAKGVTPAIMDRAVRALLPDKSLEGDFPDSDMTTSHGSEQLFPDHEEMRWFESCMCAVAKSLTLLRADRIVPVDVDDAR